MPDACQFIYSGKNGGRRGTVCGRPESDHCGEPYADHFCKGMVHHPYQRTFRCPTCGAREKPEVTNE